MANKSIVCPTAELVYRAWEKEGRSEQSRTYLGMSIIGHECEMFLWLYFRGAFKEDFDGRMYRLFDRGQREETVFCDDLRRIGCEVRDRDENTGAQFEVKNLGGHFSGHLDAIARGFAEAPKQWFVCEFKTHSSSSFKDLVKNGVKKSKPKHYAQMQSYMRETGLRKAFYFAVNKDTDDLWCEVVDYDEAFANALVDKARRVMTTYAPDRCASRPDDYRCKSCPASEVCWKSHDTLVHQDLPLTCRTCCHSTPDLEHEGACWKCALGHSCGARTCACKDFLLLPNFIKGEAVDGSQSHIVMRLEDGFEFTSGAGGFSPKELAAMTDETVRGAKMLTDEMPGAKVVGSNVLSFKWASRKVDILFRGSSDAVREWCAENPHHADWSKPGRTWTDGSVDNFEYYDILLVSIDRKTDTATVVSEQPPF